MPDIQKINAVAIADIEKLDAVTAADIEKVNGLTFATAPAVTPPLDTYTGAAAAYSVRLLRTAYTGDIMRVRRDSDNVEADVGFDSNNEFGLTSPVSNPSSGGPFTDFADFIGHGGTPANGFCRYWYDQSGNSVDAGQATSTSQPKIYDSSSGIIEEGATGKEKPAVDMPGTTEFLESNVWYASTTSYINAYYVHTNTTLNQNGYLVGSDQQDRGYIGVQFQSTARAYAVRTDGSTYAEQSSISNNTQYLRVDEIERTAISIYHNNTLGQTVTDVSNDFNMPTNHVVIGRGAALSIAYYRGRMQELIFFTVDQSSNRTGIQNNLNGFFHIY